jgi:hypothetical protein
VINGRRGYNRPYVLQSCRLRLHLASDRCFKSLFVAPFYSLLYPSHHVDAIWTSFSILNKERMFQKFGVSCSPGWLFHQTENGKSALIQTYLRNYSLPSAYKIAGIITEAIRQRRWISLHNGTKLGKDVGICFGRVGVCAHGNFNDRKSERPDIRGDAVGSETTDRLSLYSFGLI